MPLGLQLLLPELRFENVSQLSHLHRCGTEKRLPGEIKERVAGFFSGHLSRAGHSNPLTLHCCFRTPREFRNGAHKLDRKHCFNADLFFPCCYFSLFVFGNSVCSLFSLCYLTMHTARTGSVHVRFEEADLNHKSDNLFLSSLSLSERERVDDEAILHDLAVF